MKHNRMFRGQVAWLMAGVLWCASEATAAPDDGEKPPVAAAENQAMRFGMQQFDQWMFQGVGNEGAARKRLESRFDMQLSALEVRHALSDAQKKQLRLAARGDISRLFDEVEQLRRKFDALQDNNQVGQLWQEIQPLQQRLARGPVERNSLFAKVLTRTLNDEQNAAHQKVLQARLAYRYRATVEVSIAMLEDIVALDKQQREALIELLVEQTPPPAAFSQYDYYYVLYRMAELPADKIKSLVNERQWQQLRPPIQQGRSMQQMLKQNGVLDDDEEPAQRPAVEMLSR